MIRWLSFLRIMVLVVFAGLFVATVRRLSRKPLRGLVLITTGLCLVMIDLLVGAVFHGDLLPPEWLEFLDQPVGIMAGYMGQTLGFILLMIGVYRLIRSLLPHFGEYYSSLVEHSLVGVGLIQDGVFKRVNPRFAEMFGYQQRELIGKSYLDLKAPEFSATVAEQIRKCLSGEEESLHFQFKAMKKNGARFDVEVYASRVEFEGRPAIQGMLLDITQRKQAEEALRRSEEKFSKAFRTSPDPIIITTLADGRYVEVNDSFLQVTGYRRDEVIGRTSTELGIWVSPEGRNELKGKLEREGVVRNLECHFRIKSGDVRTVLLSAEVVELAGEPCLLAINKDITERKRGEKVQAAIYRISEAAHVAQDLDELFRSIHDTISQLMPAKNFYIALYDPAGETLSFPYFVDEHDEPPAAKPLGKGLTEYVLRTGEPLLAPRQVFKELVRKGEVELIGTPSVDWLGVPLKIKEKTIGILVVQSYTEGTRFSEEQKEILVFVGTQVAPAIERKRVETALRKSEERYRNLVEEINDVIFAVDKRGIITFMSPVIEQITGYHPAEVIGRSFEEFIYPDDLVALKESFRRTVVGDVSPLEYRLVTKTGQVRWVRSSSRRILAGTRGVRGVIRDITERKRAEVLLAGQKRVLEMIARGSPLRDVLEAITRLIEEQSNEMLCSILLLDEEGVRLHHGAAPSLPQSYSREIDGMAIGPEAGCCGTAAYRRERVIVSDIASDPLWAEYRELALSHGLRACWSTPILSAEGDVLGTFAMYYQEPRSPSQADVHLIDVAASMAGIAIERQRAEEALVESEERYRDLVQGVDAIVWESDPETMQFTFVSQQAEALLGYPVEQWAAEPEFWVDHLHPDDRTRARAHFLKAMREGQDHEFEFRAIASDGRVVWFRNIVRVIQDAEGHPKQLRGLMIDITEHKKMEEELLRAQKLESVGLLAGGIAHDFNNILMGIAGNLSLAKMYATRGDKLFERLIIAEKASMKASELTQQLLTFSKGGAPIKRVTSMVSILKESAEITLMGSNVRCQFSIPEDLWPVEVDRGQVSQVVNNLLINADQAMPEGGIIQVRAENTSLLGNEGLPLEPGRYVKVSIRDQGSGIRPEHLLKVFDPYFTTKQTGSGLGLSLAYSIIKRHDGHLTVESQLGVGTVFTFYLPGSQGEVATVVVAEEEPLPGHGRILLMDDDEVVRDVTSQMLSCMGYDVEVAEDGVEAVRMYGRAVDEGNRFDVVILDLTVPGGVGGKVALGGLLEIDPAVKAIVSSGYSNDPVMARYREYGFCGFVAKPYKIQDLGRLIHRLISSEDV